MHFCRPRDEPDAAVGSVGHQRHRLGDHQALGLKKKYRKIVRSAGRTLKFPKIEILSSHHLCKIRAYFVRQHASLPPPPRAGGGGEEVFWAAADGGDVSQRRRRWRWGEGHQVQHGVVLERKRIEKTYIFFEKKPELFISAFFSPPTDFPPAPPSSALGPAPLP